MVLAVIYNGIRTGICFSLKRFSGVQHQCRTGAISLWEVSDGIPVQTGNVLFGTRSVFFLWDLVCRTAIMQQVMYH